MLPEVVFEMVRDSTRFAHAAGRDDDLGFSIDVEGDGAFDGGYKMEI